MTLSPATAKREILGCTSIYAQPLVALSYALSHFQCQSFPSQLTWPVVSLLPRQHNQSIIYRRRLDQNEKEGRQEPTSTSPDPRHNLTPPQRCVDMGAEMWCQNCGTRRTHFHHIASYKAKHCQRCRQRARTAHTYCKFCGELRSDNNRSCEAHGIGSGMPHSIRSDSSVAD